MTAAQPLSCDCGRGFGSRRSLAQHLRGHRQQAERAGREGVVRVPPVPPTITHIYASAVEGGRQHTLDLDCWCAWTVTSFSGQAVVSHTGLPHPSVTAPVNVHLFRTATYTSHSICARNVSNWRAVVR
jgi:hypothetical protein